MPSAAGKSGPRWAGARRARDDCTCYEHGSSGRTRGAGMWTGAGGTTKVGMALSDGMRGLGGAAMTDNTALIRWDGYAH